MPIMCRLPPVTVGIPVSTAAGRRQIFLLVPTLTADLPAKAMLRNAHGHTGSYACSQCDIQGFSVPSGSGHCIAFIEQQNEVISKRSHNSVLQCIATALEEGEQVRLVPGNCWLWNWSAIPVSLIVSWNQGEPPVRFLNDIDYGVCFLFDEMHGFCLGMAKKVMCSWLDKNKPYSLHEDQVCKSRINLK